jgi:TolA-binding protein
MRIIYLSLVISFAFFACGGKQAETETPETNNFADAQAALAEGKSAAEVATLLMANFKSVSDATTGSLDTVASKDYVKMANELSDKFPADTMAALPLYKSAEVVRAMSDSRRAAETYQRVYDRYPTFSKSGEALFMLGFTYDEDLKDLDKAKATYERFLQAYPTHSFADDTEILLKNLGKSDAEILRELEKRAEGEQ